MRGAIALDECFKGNFLGLWRLVLPSNYDLENRYDNFSIETDPHWPLGITEQEEISMQFKIESGVPLPISGRGLPRSEQTLAIQAAMDKLAVGQSFEIPLSTEKERQNCRLKITKHAKEIGNIQIFITRKTDKGLRIYRLV